MKIIKRTHLPILATATLVTGIPLSIAIAFRLSDVPDGISVSPRSMGPPPAYAGSAHEQYHASIVDSPIDALEVGLKLTHKQKIQIAAIQKQVQQELQKPFFILNASAGIGPSPEKIRIVSDKRGILRREAEENIQAVLTAEQKQAFAHFLQEWNTLRSAGIPVEPYVALHLTENQKQQLVEIVEQAQENMRHEITVRQITDVGMDVKTMQDFRDLREQAHEKAMEVLTTAQRREVEEYIAAHPPS